MTIIYFSSDICAPCREVTRRLYEDKIRVTQHNLQDPKSAAFFDQYNVRGVPTIVILGSDGNVKDRAIGIQAIKELLF